MRAGASFTQISTTRSWQRPAPATSVSAMCASNESAVAEDGGDAALRVLGVRLVGAALGDDDDVAVRGASSAKESPAMPLPMTRKSQADGHGRSKGTYLIPFSSFSIESSSVL